MNKRRKEQGHDGSLSIEDMAAIYEAELERSLFDL
jgi:hypothetical protein